MTRRLFLTASSTIGLGSLILGCRSLDMNGLLPTNYLHTTEVKLDNQLIRVHGISTGQVRVKKSHRSSSWGMAQILVDFRWTEPMPIYTWLIEHLEGNILIDTGENIRVLEPDYLNCNPTTGWVNKKILKFKVEQELEIDAQLKSIGILPDSIRWVILTHLHLDHVDGLHHFPKAEIIVSNTEWQNPFGAVTCLFPSWLKPNRIVYAEKAPIWGKQYRLTKDGKVILVPTPGHSPGHQSLILKTDEFDLFFAGDASFDLKQLKTEEVAGICVDKAAARDTLEKINAYTKEGAVVYLPSHDAASGKRLINKDFVI